MTKVEDGHWLTVSTNKRQRKRDYPEKKREVKFWQQRLSKGARFVGNIRGQSSHMHCINHSFTAKAVPWSQSSRTSGVSLQFSNLVPFFLGLSSRNFQKQQNIEGLLHLASGGALDVPGDVHVVVVVSTLGRVGDISRGVLGDGE